MCNFGKGMHVSDSGRNGKWLGPFEDREKAFKLASSLRRQDMRGCAKCNP